MSLPVVKVPFPRVCLLGRFTISLPQVFLLRQVPISFQVTPLQPQRGLAAPCPRQQHVFCRYSARPVSLGFFQVDVHVSCLPQQRCPLLGRQVAPHHLHGQLEVRRQPLDGVLQRLALPRLVRLHLYHVHHGPPLCQLICLQPLPRHPATMTTWPPQLLFQALIRVLCVA